MEFSTLSLDMDRVTSFVASGCTPWLTLDPDDKGDIVSESSELSSDQEEEGEGEGEREGEKGGGKAEEGGEGGAISSYCFCELNRLASSMDSISFSVSSCALII